MSTLKILELLASEKYKKFEIDSEQDVIRVTIHRGKLSYISDRAITILLNNLFVNQKVVIGRKLFGKITLWKIYLNGRRDVL